MLLSLALGLGALFAHSFLDMRRTAPRAGLAMRGVIGAGAMLAVIAAAGWPLDYGGVLRTISVLGFATAAIATTVAVRAMVAGYRPARYFLLAWAALLIFIALGALRNFTLVPTNLVTIYGLHIGFALDVLLLSFALGASARPRKPSRCRRSSACWRPRARASASWSAGSPSAPRNSTAPTRGCAPRRTSATA
jgi:hypothetical protein